WSRCEWKLTASGGVVRDVYRDPGPKPALASLGAPGALEITRAWSPKHDRLAVLSLRRQNDIKRDLRLTVADAKGHVERNVALVNGEFYLDDSGIGVGETAAPGTYAIPPNLTFLDDTRLVVSPGVGSLEPMAVNVASGEVERPCKGIDSCALDGRF